MHQDALARARDFVYANGRVLDRRLFGARFDGEDPAGVVAALLAHRNPDGGFAHGLEPDTRTPHSQPLDTWIALELLRSLGGPADEVVRAACDWLASVASPDGGVPTLLPTIVGYPRASHWAENDEYPPSLLPTADVTAVLLGWGVDHPWIERATDWCFAHLEQETPTGAHEIRSGLTLLAEAPERPASSALADRLVAALSTADWYRADPDDPAYGVTPWSIAPTPDNRWRSLFDDALFEAHLDRLERDQEPDGGWAVSWQPAEGASLLDCRSATTLEALTVLQAHGRLDL
jgi:hypothetical protein